MFEEFLDPKIRILKLRSPVTNIVLRTVMGFREFARVRANPFLERRDNQRNRSCFLL